MIFAEPTALASDYETLRSAALGDALVGGHFGLVVLMREGMAAWMKQATRQAVTGTPRVAKDVLTGTPLIPDGLRADVALVLASMVMTTHEERCA